MRSTDGGSTWSTVYDSSSSGALVQDPGIDKDANGDLYVTGNTYNASVDLNWETNIWKFQAGSFSSAPQHTVMHYGASKYSMIYDPAHNELDLRHVAELLPASRVHCRQRLDAGYRQNGRAIQISGVPLLQ